MAPFRHGEEPGDVQDIRVVVDTIPTLAWSTAPDGSAVLQLLAGDRWSGSAKRIGLAALARKF